MTKEPIMIDDIDVSECVHKMQVYEDYKCEIYNLEQCSDVPNCYYKQLKRKEQELVTANCMVLTSNMRNGQLFERLNQLEAELKEFKDMAKQGLDNYKDVGGCWGCGISFSFDELLKSYKKLETKNAILISNRMNMFERLDIVQENKKYKQALQQIRQVVEFAMEEVLTIGQRNATAKILEILQKCEVLNGNQ